MNRSHIVAMMVLVVAVPAATAGSFFASNSKPCFISGNAGYELTGGGAANTVVRIDNAPANPSLRMQIVDDAGAADFVLVDDADTVDACTGATAIESIRINPAAAKPDLTVALSRQPADYKIFVRSATFSEQDAAALFAAIWKNASKANAAKIASKTNAPIATASR